MRSASRSTRRAMIDGAVVLVLLLLIAVHGVGGGQPAFNGSWRSNNPLQTGMNPPRRVTFGGNDTVVLGLGVGVEGQDVQHAAVAIYASGRLTHL